MKRLLVSQNRRFLVREDGTPFFWLGDTAWEIFHRASIEEAELYLKRRRLQGFNVVHGVALAEFDGLHTPNVYGDCPLVKDDPLQPNEAYFRHVDRVIEIAAQNDIWVGLLPTWGDKLELLAHGKGPVIFNPQNARTYGEWIGRRYRQTWNIIWINGGDRQGGGANRPIWEALAEGIKCADPNHLMTFHPLGGGGGHSSSEWFHESDWLDFNLAQSGHERKHLANYGIIERDYKRVPTKPCLDGEPRYEDHPVAWKPQEFGWFDDYDVRQAAYWAVFAGAFGHSYGCHPVWQFLDHRYPPIGLARRYWKEALELPGAGQLKHLRNLIESRHLLSRVPDQALVVNQLDDGAHCQACRGTGYAFVYLPQGGKVEVNLEILGERMLRACWFDPRTGQTRLCRELPGRGTAQFEAPFAGPCSDWVLVLDSQSQNLPLPGAVSNVPHSKQNQSTIP
ncbi:MAG TPA: glycoside hydrolase family 140 protein [Verrucomicrobiae bacterium]|nr:glycoside hydrolase family 140 protein [Verrucomicrobiae bacterium]